MRIGFVGAGKVATAFGRYIHSKGAHISGYLDRHADKTAHACESTASRVFDSLGQLAGQSDVILITTRDDQIAGVGLQMCAQHCVEPRHLVGHMSGAHSSRILEAVSKQGAAAFSLHPLQAFADEDQSLAALPHTYFSLEGAPAATDELRSLLKQMGNPYFKLRAEHKSLYHLAACVLSNYLVTLMHSGLGALQAADIDPGTGFSAMRPLIEGTLNNIGRLGSAKALTGPIARGDTGTIEHHLETLNRMGLEELKSVYTFLGLKTLDLATEEILTSSNKADALRQLLAKR